MKVTVYSKPKCVACENTERQFDKYGIEYEKVMLDDDLIEEFKADGLLSAPVVVVELGDGASWQWSGYRHTSIFELKELFSDAA